MISNWMLSLAQLTEQKDESFSIVADNNAPQNITLRRAVYPNVQLPIYYIRHKFFVLRSWNTEYLWPNGGCYGTTSNVNSGIFLSNFQGGGGDLRFWTFFDKFWTFHYAAGFRGPGILIKRSTIVDLSVYAAWLRGPDISQHIQKRITKYPKSRLPSFHI